jgi:hypothetical protein
MSRRPSLSVPVAPHLAAAGLFLVLSVGLPSVTAAQDPAALQAGASSRLRVYLDCSNCFDDYLRDEIDWVDFVRQPQDADVHLLSSDAGTASGGRELVLRFVGAGRFQGVDHELRVVSLVNEAESVRRADVLRTVTVGLLGYLARAGLPSGLDLSVESSESEDGSSVFSDPWNLWVFEVSAGGEFEAEESNRQVQWDTNFAGDRISEAWKISFGVSVDHQSETFNLDEEDPFEVDQRERSLDWFVAKSLGPHWSVGFEGRVEQSTFANTKISSEVSPAVEYSVFPYQDYATRQLVLLYELGFEVVQYYEMTLFDKLEETLWSQEIAVRLDQRQPWGSLQAGVQWSQYLHDLDKYRLEAEGEISLNLTRGLSLEVEGSASRIRDQLSIPRRGATPEEVLLELRELLSAYDVGFSVGVSYSFGSLFNNVVNPRFDD